MTEQDYLRDIINHFEARTGTKPRMILTDGFSYHLVKSLDPTQDYLGIPVIAATDVVITYPNFKNKRE